MPLVLTPLEGLPEIRPGDDLAALVAQALVRCSLALEDGDVLVVSSKVASKAMGLVLDLDPGGEDPAVARAQVVRAQSQRVVAERVGPAGALTQVVEAVSGPVMAAAGVDASNTGASGSAPDRLLVLPADPDGVCRDLRTAWCQAFGVRRLGVVLSDTAGRPWRAGQTDFALGAAGLVVLDDLSGSVDADGRPLLVTARALADEVAAAADLVKGKTAGLPVAHLRGLGDWVPDPDRSAPYVADARSLVRTGALDWFALGSAEAVRAALGVQPGTSLAARVGIASTGPEPVQARIARAVAVALAGMRDVDGDGDDGRGGLGVDVGSEGLVVTGSDPVCLGMLAARLVVALAGEGLPAHIERTAGALESVAVTLRPA